MKRKTHILEHKNLILKYDEISIQIVSNQFKETFRPFIIEKNQVNNFVNIFFPFIFKLQI